LSGDNLICNCKGAKNAKTILFLMRLLTQKQASELFAVSRQFASSALCSRGGYSSQWELRGCARAASHSWSWARANISCPLSLAAIHAFLDVPPLQICQQCVYFQKPPPPPAPPSDFYPLSRCTLLSLSIWGKQIRQHFNCKFTCRRRKIILTTEQRDVLIILSPERKKGEIANAWNRECEKNHICADENEFAFGPAAFCRLVATSIRIYKKVY